MLKKIKYCTNIELKLERIKQYELHQKLEDERIQLEKERKKISKNKDRRKETKPVVLCFFFHTSYNKSYFFLN